MDQKPVVGATPNPAVEARQEARRKQETRNRRQTEGDFEEVEGRAGRRRPPWSIRVMKVAQHIKTTHTTSCTRLSSCCLPSSGSLASLRSLLRKPTTRSSPGRSAALTSR